MANLKKYTTKSFCGIAKHCLREIMPSNADPQRTSTNYNLCEHGNTYADVSRYYRQRLSELHVMQRADVKTNCNWTITAPKDLPAHLHQKFFQETKTFLDKKYGEENNLYATVHMDEATPHMHYSFIPTVYDVKRGRLKVSAYEVLTKQHLTTWHNEFSQYLKSKGIACDTSSGITRAQGGNRTINELKQSRWHEQKHELSHLFSD